MGLFTRYRYAIWLTAVLIAVESDQPASGQIPAFSGADGVAMNVSGGRANGSGQIVYHVTRLESAIDDPLRNEFGTLRYGLNNSNFPTGVPRTIVFDVGGVFHLGRLSQAGWDPNGNGWDAQSRLTIGGTNVTLAGQTAPGAGVIFMGGGLKPQGDNNIIRNVTVASGYGMRNWWKPGDPFPDVPEANPSSPGPGIFPDATVYDAMDISGTNLMIDHITALYATDEAISMNEVANNITVQYANISQGQNYPQWDAEGGGYTGHALGSLLEAGDGNQNPASISFHHNLYAHQKSRIPQLQGGVGAYDFRNNVFYNWFGTAGNIRGITFLNLVGNFYLSGEGGDDPVGGNNTTLTTRSGGTSVVSAGNQTYRLGNLLDSNNDGDANDGVLVEGGAANPQWIGGVDTYSGVTEAADVAYDRVLDYVGANWWTRDNVINTPDERIINEVRTGTGKIVAWADDPWNNDPYEGTEWRNLVSTPQTSRANDWDTEADIGYGVGDGMPTHWELQHGLDPNARDDAGDFDNDGYTNLEDYLNEIAAWPAPNAIVFNNANGDGRFAHILNWDANPDSTSVHPWQPSRFDTAVIDNGTITVDAVGQHAGNVLLATGAGDNAVLNLSSGWLKVHDETHGLSDGTVVIGDHQNATASLNLSGGQLVTKALIKGAGGQFNFTGGTLTTEMVGFDLVNNGGTIAPGESAGATMVFGDLTINSGSLEIELGGLLRGSEFDYLDLSGAANLGGTLDVGLIDSFVPLAGDFFHIITALGGIFNEFDTINLPSLSGGLDWRVVYGETLVGLEVVSNLPGDYHPDGVIDGLDFLAWQRGESPNPLSAADLATWQSNYGNGSQLANSSNAVPEPASCAGLVVCLMLTQVLRRRRSFLVGNNPDDLASRR